MNGPDKLHLTPRLYTAADLGAGRTVAVTPGQAHYLKNVMRLKPGDSLRLFNGREGEWRGVIGSAAGKGAKLTLAIAVGARVKPQIAEPDLWLCCAPIKKAHFDFLIEKATELGVSALQPVLTARTQVREVNGARAHAIAVEAAEQSERLSVPAIEKPATLKELVARWPAERTPIVCAEWGDAVNVKKAFEDIDREDAPLTPTKAAIITGPEGGFTAEELAMLRAMKNVRFIRLGPRILRADTAAIAALGCWQAIRGDWR